MKKYSFSTLKLVRAFNKWPDLYLLVGIVLMTLSHLNQSIALFAWICMVPFLMYLSAKNTKKAVLKFSVALLISWSLIILKIITPPIPLALVFMYSIPIAMVHMPAYLLWKRYNGRPGAWLLFPVVLTLMEWVQYSFTPLGSWGSAAYMQMGQMAIMQSVSLFGFAGLSFLIYWANAAFVQLLRNKNRASLGWFVLVFLGLLVYGEYRFDQSRAQTKVTTKVAAVGTDSEAGGLPLPLKEDNEKHMMDVFERSRKAARAGAELVVWTEAAFILEPSYEKQWIDSMQALANTYQIVVVASYVNVVSKEPFKYENKYLMLKKDGSIAMTYLKHQPVPGEPAIKGKEKLKVIETGGSLFGAAICYDYDFPYLAKGFGDLGADIIGLPSSDWRGIDPLHTEMAAFRAIEQGHSILRSTRFGLSAAISPYGEIVSKLSSFSTSDKLMLAELPSKGVRTLYGVVGDVFIYANLLFLIGFFGAQIASRFRE